MKTRRLLLIILVLLSLAAPVGAVGQISWTPNQESFDIDVYQMASCFGVTSDRLVTVNTTPVIHLKNPLVLQGSGAGVLEVNGFSAYLGSHSLKSSLIVGDQVTSFYDRPLSEYDLILLGGPEHNQRTKQLVEQGILQCDGTDVKMPGLVIEVAEMPVTGQKIVVVGDVTGFPYHKKDLPLNGILPETLAPAAAIATGMIMGVIGAYLESNGTLPATRRKVRRMIGRYLNPQRAEAASEMDTGDEYYGEPSFLKEIALLVFCILVFGGAFIVADRLALDLPLIGMYLVMGAIAVIMHELGHRMIAQKLGIEGEYKFWGLGSLTMLLTSWLFGMAFAQPGRYIFYDSDDLENRDMAFVTLAGPAVSMLFAIVFLPFALIGGVMGDIAVAGFTMNLMTAVYNLLPISPMDGKFIYEWSRVFWMVTFVPLALFFILMTLLFV